MKDQSTIDVAFLAMGLAIEAESPGAVAACRWDGSRWVQPDGVEFTDREKEAVSYLLAVREIDRAARRVVAASRSRADARRALAAADRELNAASSDLVTARAREEFIDGLPGMPIAIDGAVVVYEKKGHGARLYRAVVGRPIGLDAAPLVDGQ